MRLWIDEGSRRASAAGRSRKRVGATMAAVIERDLRDHAMRAQSDLKAQRDGLWHLLEACESFGGPTVRALARKRFEIFDGADVPEHHDVEREVAAELVVAFAW